MTTAAIPVPPGYVGMLTLPGTGRQVYWTGRLAIGLRHQPARDHDRPVAESELWVQQALLDAPKGGRQ